MSTFDNRIYSDYSWYLVEQYNGNPFILGPGICSGSCCSANPFMPGICSGGCHYTNPNARHVFWRMPLHQPPNARHVFIRVPLQQPQCQAFFLEDATNQPPMPLYHPNARILLWRMPLYPPPRCQTFAG